MMQKTDFPFEVLIHDDASKDATADIVREYETLYPEIIKPIYSTENKYSKGIDIFSSILLPKAKGKYIAICEGDDYWTDPLKLQKQVDFLESNPNYALVCHQYSIKKGTAYESSAEWLKSISHFDHELYISSNTWFIQPLTVLFRTCIFNHTDYSLYRNSKDVTLFYYLLKFGDGFLMQDEMGVYRLHGGGSFSNLTWADKIIENLKTISSINDVECDKTSAFMLKRYFDGNVSYLGRKTILEERQFFYSLFRKLRSYFGFNCMFKRLLSVIFKVNNVG
jgi:glycosyltransferase involved in cell wall biosynthesis